MSTNDPSVPPSQPSEPAPPPQSPGAPQPPADQPAPPPQPGYPAPDAQQPPPQQQPGDYQQPPPPQAFQQPGYQQPAPSSDGLDPKVGALLAYLLGIIGGLIMYLTQKHPEVRFHGAQSILLVIGLTVFWIAWTILTIMMAFVSSALASLFGTLFWLIGLAAFGLWILLCIKAYNLEHFKLPIIGDMAESWAAK